jgi:hypothetical protein
MGWFDFLSPDFASLRKDDPVDLWGWIVALIGATIGFVGALGIFYYLYNHVHVCFALMWSIFLIFLPKLLGTDGDEEVVAKVPKDVRDKENL